MAENEVLLNEAFVFIKPHAVTDQTKVLVKEMLEAANLVVTREGVITSEEIDEKKLIDNHYYAIASKATLLQPHELNVPADRFEEKFGISWQAALESGNVYNAIDGAAQLGMNATELEQRWRQAKGEKTIIKFGGGFYCAKLGDIYVFNGFFMSMRSKYVEPGKSIYYYTVQWDQEECSWEDFRGKLLGPTDPSAAPEDSVRGRIYAEWETLGLPALPDTGDNGVHASASPFEALAERMNWLGIELEDDSYGRAMIGAGIRPEVITAWTVDPQVQCDPEGTMGSCFDALEDMQASDCLDKAIHLHAYLEY